VLGQNAMQLREKVGAPTVRSVKFGIDAVIIQTTG
jgi:hypothetical protein